MTDQSAAAGCMDLPSHSHLVLIPSYNPGRRFLDTVVAASKVWQPVWVVVDGSDRIVGESVDERIREQIEEVLAETFKPEFLNRIDDTVIFHRLSKQDIGRIVELQVSQLIGRVQERGIEIELTDDARTLLGNLGYDPTYGARPLKRVIQKQLVDRLALAILEGEFGEGDTVRIDAADGALVFERAAERAAAAA